MINTKTPYNRVEIVSSFENCKAILEEFFVFQLPKNKFEIEDVLIKNIFSF